MQHSGWLRPHVIREIRQFLGECDALLLEGAFEPEESSEEIQDKLSQKRGIFNSFASGDWPVDECLPLTIRISHKRVPSQLDLYMLSIWQIVNSVQKLIYHEAEAWADEDYRMPGGEKISPEIVQRSVCEGNRQGLFEEFTHFDQQCQQNAVLRDARVDEWLSQQGKRTWGVLFGMDHSFRATVNRRNYGNYTLRRPENQERLVLYWLLSQQPSPIVDRFAPLDAYQTLAHEISLITDEQLNTIWHILEVNGAGWDESQYIAQLNRIASHLRYIRPEVSHLWHAEFESEFKQVFHLTLDEVRLIARGAGGQGRFER